MDPAKSVEGDRGGGRKRCGSDDAAQHGATEPDLELRLTAAPGEARIRDGALTRVLRYTGEVLRGRADALRISDSYLGPALDLRRGERVRIVFRNRTGEPSIVHWHGMLVPEEADGHPRFAVDSGGEYLYEFTVRNPAGTYLYHPHPHGRTAPQVYSGLAGLLIVREPDEAKRALPGREHELAIVIQDRRSGNSFSYSRGMMTQMSGLLGDVVLANGRADAVFRVTPRAWRLRLANVSNARVYKLAWSDGRPLRVIGTDSGLLPGKPLERPYLVLAPFERVEILEDFGTRAPGAEIALESLEFSSLSMGSMMGNMMGGGGMGGMMGGMGEMMRGMMGPEQGEPLTVARFVISRDARVKPSEVVLPASPHAPEKPAAELYSRVSFRRMRGFFNGRDFDMDAVADDERLPLGRPTVWTFENDGGGMPMPHPIHIHGVRFRILERRGDGAPQDLREGLIDAGFKDTFLIFPGERVKVHVVPTEPGMFMYHCHNLEHEDGGMMRNCLFRA